ncbi:hypothetical protein [Streptomyces sp. G45]|uniref:hypothetical protein n=1 Tax=Streptomyces sp. G45 TaxID=3406627 RepID=UPI003C1E810A
MREHRLPNQPAPTDTFLSAARLLPPGCSVSLDLSHIGLAVDVDLALANASRLAQATADTGREMMISAEGSDRTDDVLALHGALCERFDHVGLTIQARLYRTADDLPELLSRPGRIRLVKGAFLEPDAVAHRREAPALATAYLAYAQQLAEATPPGSTSSSARSGGCPSATASPRTRSACSRPWSTRRRDHRIHPRHIP